MAKKNKNKPGKRKRTDDQSKPIPPKQRTHERSVRARNDNAFPLPFPDKVPFPKDSFLRESGDYKKSFQRALKTSYEGFCVDKEDETKTRDKDVRKALAVLEQQGFFRTDVTQPFGLGTRCAKTYVTRCLLGDPGTTYKYLGLRMFSYPWKAAVDTENRNKPKGATTTEEALHIFFRLNENLTERTRHHLNQLNKVRKARGGPPTRGRAGFDITLINRMEYSSNLKMEPSTGEGRCAVSWHADSSLEHFSTIAVYHTVKPKTNHHWSVGLRVAHNSEGPQASRRGTDIAVESATPPIAVSLPSASTYYLLDDFNHHHQHAVFTTSKESGLRFSSTHRLLRESHNVNHILGRCKNICANFHKKGPKLWRSEQLVLNELESEWIRQFYIQGQQHYCLLWKPYWEGPIEQLLKYWSQLEGRTRQTLDFLMYAAEGKCGADIPAECNGTPSRAARKLRERRKKATTALEEIVQRQESTELMNIYQSFADLLKERASMRELWALRESDRVFYDLKREGRPMEPPLDFGISPDKKSAPGRGVSPMPGTAEELRRLAGRLLAYGAAFASGDKSELPPQEKEKSEASKTDEKSNQHKKDPLWEGWTLSKFGLELQEPWAGLLVDGKKTIETRAYALPEALLGKKVQILQSRKGCVGKSGLGNEVDIDGTSVAIIGWCKFSKVIKYTDQPAFEGDEQKHLVARSSGYGWKKNLTTVIYGWLVSDFERVSTFPLRKATRRYRSLFELHHEDVN